MVHGHVHESWLQSGSQINVGIDAWGGRVANATREIADTIARHLELPTSSISDELSETHFGGCSTIMGLDFPAMTGSETQQLLGWEPSHPGLIEDLEGGY